MKKYNKLVRDLVPALIRANGGTCTRHVASQEELHEKIGRKLLEEINEFANAKNAEELIDVMEIVNAIEAFGKHTRPELEVVSHWIASAQQTDDEDVLLKRIFELDDAATEYVVSRSDNAFIGLVLALEAAIKTTGFERETLELMRLKKLETHGGFEFGIILDEA